MIKGLAHNFIKGEKVSKSITKSAVLIAIMSLLSKILGLFRDRILASHFGAGDVLDVYYAAFKVPDLIYTLLITGALSAAFIPVFSSLIAQKKEKEAWKLVNNLFSVGSLLVIGFSVLFFIASNFLVGLMTFGYSEEKKTLVVQMTRIMLMSPFLLGISGVFGGILNSYKKFFFYSLAPIFYNLGIIFGAVVLVKYMGIFGLAFGVVLGAALHLIIQFPEVKRCGFRFFFNFDWKNKYLKRILTLMIPRTLGIASAQINLVIIIALASTLNSGSLAIFNLANNLQSVPLSLFGVSFAVASFPVLASLWADNKKTEFVLRLTMTLRKILFFIIPISALIFVLRAQIVRIILGAGKFNWEDTRLTFTALGIFTISLWAQSIIPLLARAFYAIHNTKIPFLVGLFSGIVNIILAVLLLKNYSVLGLVLAFSVANIVNALMLFFLLKVKIGKIRNRKIINTFIKVFVATIVMAIVVQILKILIGTEPFGAHQTFIGVLTQLIVSAIGGLSVFILMCWILKVPELKYFSKAVYKKIFLKKQMLDDIDI